jgi:hypothetical protein
MNIDPNFFNEAWNNPNAYDLSSAQLPADFAWSVANTEDTGTLSGVMLQYLNYSDPLDFAGFAAPDISQQSLSDHPYLAMAPLLLFAVGDVLETLAVARGFGLLGNFSATTTSAGGTLWLSDGAIFPSTYSSIAQGALSYDGQLTILSGVHGFADGSTVVDFSLYLEDVATYGNYPGANIYNIAGWAQVQINALINNVGTGTIIGAFCFSGACLSGY